MVDALVPWERDDPDVIAIMTATGGELDRVEVQMLLVRDQAWPHKADDTLGLLAIHERTFQLPVAPSGATIPQRQAAIKTRVGRRRNGRKAVWVDRMNDLVGVGNWDYAENTPGAHQITITLRIEPTSGLSARMRALIEVFTPVVDEIIISFAAGFLLGIGSLGDDAL